MRDYAMVMRLLKRDLSQYPCGGLTDCVNRSEAASTLISRELFKKLAPSGQTQDAIDKTIDKFMAINQSIPDVPRRCTTDDESLAYMLSLFQDEMWQLLDTDSAGCGCDFEFISENFRSGPGASRKADSTTWYSKFFESDHSYTDPHVLALFRAAISRSDTWSDAYMLWSKEFKPVMVSGNSLFTVPKNSEISRTCCTEPLLNMVFQQAVGAFIERRLEKRLGLNLSRQPDLNRRLTRIGSINGTYGTIDLSSASDSIALSLVQWSVPPSVLRWINLFRSKVTRLPSGNEVELRMVSTMGNGYTFPLETAIFASAVRAVYRAKAIQPRLGTPSDNYAVFGDDLVVREDCYNATIRLLNRLGFHVNEGKSFNSGPFRESCGFDYWLGENIRPVFIETLETAQDVYSSFNRLSRWSAENSVPLVRTLRYLWKMAPDNRVPFSEGDDSGFKVPSVIAPFRLSSRFWRKYSVLVPIETGLPVPEGRVDALSLGYKSFNPHGWELAYIGLYARTPDNAFEHPATSLGRAGARYDGVIMRRPYQGEVLPRRLRTKDIPHWDWFGATDEGRFNRSSFQRWEALVEGISIR